MATAATPPAAYVYQLENDIENKFYLPEIMRGKAKIVKTSSGVKIISDTKKRDKKE